MAKEIYRDTLLRQALLCLEARTQKGLVLMDADTIRAIRREYVAAKGKSATNVMELAIKYGVKQETIRKIALRKTYKEVE
jgi:ssRNA-specific RNase YbeY (16S rRNA maturation enzyme)